MATDVHLTRTCPTVPWGFSLSGGVEYGAPITVAKVIPHSLAFEAEMLDGDVVLEINGVPTANLTQEQLRVVVMGSGNILGLKLLPRRSGTPLPLEYTAPVISFEPDNPTKEVPINRPQSPFIQRNKQYRPFSTKPIDGLPPLEHPIILSPNYKDDFSHIAVRDYEIDSIYKLQRSSEYEENATRITLSSNSASYEELYKAIEVGTNDIVNGRSDIACKVEASDVVSDVIENATKRISNGDVEYLAKLIDHTTDEICKKFSIEESKIESKAEYSETSFKSTEESIEMYSEEVCQTKTNGFSVQSNEQVSNSFQSNTGEKMESESSHHKEEFQNSVNIEESKSESRSTFNKEEMKSESQLNTEETKSETETSVSSTVTKIESMEDERQSKIDRKAVLDNIKTISEQMQHVESSSSELNEIKNQALNTANMLTEQRTYRSLTMPGVQGTVHSSPHYDLLLKTFFIHLTDVMVALSRLISADHPITRASTPAHYERTTEKRQDNVVTTTAKVAGENKTTQTCSEAVEDIRRDEVSRKEKVVSQFSAVKSKEMTQNIAAITSELGEKLEKLHIEERSDAQDVVDGNKIMYVATVVDAHTNINDELFKQTATKQSSEICSTERIVEEKSEHMMNGVGNMTSSKYVETMDATAISISSSIHEHKESKQEKSVNIMAANVISQSRQEFSGNMTEETQVEIVSNENNVISSINQFIGDTTAAINTVSSPKDENVGNLPISNQPETVSNSGSGVSPVTPLTPPTPLTDEYIFRLQIHLDESKIDPNFAQQLQHEVPCVDVDKKTRLVPHYESCIGPFVPYALNNASTKSPAASNSLSFEIPEEIHRRLSSSNRGIEIIGGISDNIDTGAKGIKIISGMSKINIPAKSKVDEKRGITIISGVADTEHEKGMKIISGITNADYVNQMNTRRISNNNVDKAKIETRSVNVCEKVNGGVEVISGMTKSNDNKALKIISGITNVSHKNDTISNKAAQISNLTDNDHVTIVSGISDGKQSKGLKIISGVTNVSHETNKMAKQDNKAVQIVNMADKPKAKLEQNADHVTIVSGISDGKQSKGLKIISGIANVHHETSEMAKHENKAAQITSVADKSNAKLVQNADHVTIVSGISDGKQSKGLKIISGVANISSEAKIIPKMDVKANDITVATNERYDQTKVSSISNIESHETAQICHSKTKTADINVATLTKIGGLQAKSDHTKIISDVTNTSNKTKQVTFSESYEPQTKTEVPLPSGYRSVRFDVTENRRDYQEKYNAVINEANNIMSSSNIINCANTTQAGQVRVGTTQGIMYGLDSAFNEENLEDEMGKPGLSDEKIAEMMSGEAEVLKEAHVIGLRRALYRHMYQSSDGDDDDSSVNFKKLKPQIEALKDSEVLKALNEEILKTREEKKKEERKWTTFLQKPSRPVPRARFGHIVEPIKPIESYKVKIVKQPKPKVAPDFKPEDFETGPLPWELRAANEPPPPPVPQEDPILIPEEPPQFLEALDNLPESEVPDLEDTGIVLPPQPPQLPQLLEEELVKEDEAIEEDFVDEIREDTQEEAQVEEQEEEMDQSRLAAQVLSNLQGMVDPNASMEDQLHQMQAQLAVLATLPQAIHQTLEIVTKQLGSLAQRKTEVHETRECVEITETTSTETSECHAQESCKQECMAVCETMKKEAIKLVADEISEEQIKIDVEEMERMKKEEESMRIIEQQKKELMAQLQQEHAQKQIKQRPTPQPGRPKPAFGPLTPQERPVFLPGGRKWRTAKDAYNEEFIRDTLTAQAELIQGKVKGGHFESHRLPYDQRVNFLKYQKPPISLDHLKDSDVYKMVHHMDEPVPKGIEQIRPYVMAESEYREKCRSVTPNFDKMAANQQAQFLP